MSVVQITWCAKFKPLSPLFLPFFLLHFFQHDHGDDPSYSLHRRPERTAKKSMGIVKQRCIRQSRLNETLTDRLTFSHYLAFPARLQEELRERIVLKNQVNFDTTTLDDLNYIGGVDLSFPGDDNEHAVACLVVMKYPSLEVRERKKNRKPKSLLISSFVLFLRRLYIQTFWKQDCTCHILPGSLPFEKWSHYNNSWRN